MAYSNQLTTGGSILEHDIRAGLVIPMLEQTLVATNFVTMETVLDAKSVDIWGVVRPQIKDYTGSTTQEEAKDKSVTLVLDEAKYFETQIDRIDVTQEDKTAKIIGRVLQLGMEGIAMEIDTFIFETLSATTNSVATIALNEANVKTWILSLKTKLDNLKCPKLNRKLAITPEVGALLAGLNMTFNDTSNVDQAVKTGFVTRFGGFDIFESTNLADGTAAGSKWAIACVPSGAYGAIGYQEAGIVRPALGFKDIAHSLVNYGSEIAEPAFVVKCDPTIA